MVTGGTSGSLAHHQGQRFSREAKDRTPPRADTVVKGEAIDVLNRWSDRSVGAVITDPPFFTSIGRNEGPEGGLGVDPWSDIRSIESAHRWASPLMAEFARVVRRGGAVVLMAGVHASAAWMQAAEDAGLVWMAEMMVLWNTGRPRGRNFGSLHTHILWFAVPGAKHTWNSSRRSIYSNILVADKIPPTRRLHPAQKPVELTTFLVSLLSRPDDIILDPFCGSGSTLVSAEIAGREWVGIDRDQRYVQIARQRPQHHELEEEGRLCLWTNGRLEEV